MSTYTPGVICLVRTAAAADFGPVKSRPAIVVMDLGPRALLCPLSSSRRHWPIKIGMEFGVKRTSYCTPYWFETMHGSCLGTVVGRIPDTMLRDIREQIVGIVNGGAA